MKATITVWVIGLLIALIFGVDLVLLVSLGYEGTISATLLAWCRTWPIVSFLIGMCFGHVLWPNRAANKECPK